MTTSFIKHTGSVQPVSDDSLVSYRTITDDGVISHVHLPVKASALNWSSEGLSFGRIYDFKIAGVVKETTGAAGWDHTIAGYAITSYNAYKVRLIKKVILWQH